MSPEETTKKSIDSVKYFRTAVNMKCVNRHYEIELNLQSVSQPFSSRLVYARLLTFGVEINSEIYTVKTFF